MVLIDVQGLALGYDNNIILSDLDFKVEEGDYLCIVGENGSGKSTLMKTLLGLQKPLGGNIVFSEGLKEDQIGYLPQKTEAQMDFPASVWEIVISGCLSKQGIGPFYRKVDKERAKREMERMGITGLKNKCFRELSGGQQQRVLLARALCAAEKVLVLDEPVSGLDPKVTKEMYSLIEELNKDGMTVIMVSHDISAALRYADRILHIGEKLFFGTKEEYKTSSVSFGFLEKGSDEQ